MKFFYYYYFAFCFETAEQYLTIMLNVSSGEMLQMSYPLLGDGTFVARVIFQQRKTNLMLLFFLQVNSGK